MLFGNDRTALRRFYLEAWRKLRDNQPLEPLERQVAEVVSEHPEYHALLESEDTLVQDYTPEMGQSNPFLHMGMHLAIREQLGGDRPAGIVTAYRTLLLRLGDAHTVEHHMMECLGQALWEAQRAGRAPDEAAYLDCLKKG
ncbi:MAG: DUF1841 family protein [Pseudomonadota bacterium]